MEMIKIVLRLGMVNWMNVCICVLYLSVFSFSVFAFLPVCRLLNKIIFMQRALPYTRISNKSMIVQSFFFLWLTISFSFFLISSFNFLTNCSFPGLALDILFLWCLFMCGLFYYISFKISHLFLYICSICFFYTHQQ